MTEGLTKLDALIYSLEEITTGLKRKRERISNGYTKEKENLGKKTSESFINTSIEKMLELSQELPRNVLDIESKFNNKCELTHARVEEKVKKIHEYEPRWSGVARPRGRAPKGKSWSRVQGCWVEA